MIDTKKILADFRAEISAELDAARKSSSDVDEEHTAAVTDDQVKGSAYIELRNTLAAITNRPAGRASVPLAGPLALRLDEHKRAAAAASNRKASAHGARQELVRRISELVQAIEQIDQVISPAPADTEEAADPT
jgi:hypothetical protein